MESVTFEIVAILLCILPFSSYYASMRTVTYGHKDLNLVAVTIFKTVYNSLQTLSALQGIQCQ